jgi:hypothetical protein
LRGLKSRRVKRPTAKLAITVALSYALSPVTAQELNMSFPPAAVGMSSDFAPLSMEIS